MAITVMHAKTHSNILHNPAPPLHPIIFPWSFMRWRQDIVGKIPTAPSERVFMLAKMDYFSKWIKVEALVQVREK